MNHIYRVVFNHQTGTFQAVSEIAKTPHKTGKTKSAKIFKALLTPISLALSLAFGLSAHASPKDGQVTAGVATIHQNGLITDINQTSQNAAINWQSFNIAHNETVNFNQPNAGAITLNRVIGNEKSVIDGAMNANGKVFISNANGMLIGKDAKINVGSLVATTANISDNDLMNGRYSFTGDENGSVENLGQITVPKGGVVALVAPIVKNGGKITAHEGNVLLASAENFSITLPDNANFKYTLDKGTLQGLVDNGGAILADGGRVVLTAQGVDTVKKSLIKHTGAIQANTVQNKNGVIELLGDLDNSALTVSGSLKAEAKESGDGGFIETSASQVKIEDSAEVSTLAQNGKSGTWLIDPTDFIITPDGDNDTSGSTISGKSLTNALKQTDMIVRAMGGTSKTDKGDVIVNDDITWSKHTLTLNAHNDIHINKTMNGSGTAKLALEYGQGTADGGESDYYLDKNTPLKDRTVKVNLPEGKNFSIKKGSNGEMVEFDVIHEIPNNGSLTEKVAFGKDIDLSKFSNVNRFNGIAMYYHNDVHGLGHSMKNLTINSSQDGTGVFSGIGHTDKLRDIVLDNINITSTGNNIGGLSGWIAGDIKNISIKNSRIQGNNHVGGLIGLATRDQWLNYKASNNIENTYSSATVSGQDGIGGILGMGYIANLSNATNEGEVSGHETVGGIVGHGNGEVSIRNSSSLGNISGVTSVGGLGGAGFRSITNSYSKGNIRGRINIGGILGHSAKQVYENNYSEATVKGENSVGGLIGRSFYATVKNSYFNGNVYGLRNTGAIVGLNSMTDIKTFYNQDKQKIGESNIDRTAKTDSELRTPSTFKDWDFEKVWYMNQNADGTYSYPMLRAFAQTLTVNPTPTPPTAQTTAGVKAPDLSKTYDGKAITSVDDLKKLDGWKDNFDATGLATGDSVKNIFKAGTLTIDETKGDWKGAKDVKEGGYELYPTGTLKDEYQQKYIIEWNKGTLTINPAKLTITAMNNIKPEGDSNPDVSRIGVVVQGLVEGESISDVNLSYSDDKKWQGDISIVRVGEPVFKNGKASNYEITKKDGKLLTVQKEYDLKNITDKKPEDVAKIRDLLNSVEDEMLLAHAVYGSDSAKKGDNDRFYEVWEIKDNNTGAIMKEKHPLGYTPPTTDPHKTYKKLYELVNHYDYSAGTVYLVDYTKVVPFGWSEKLLNQEEYDKLVKSGYYFELERTFRDGLYPSDKVKSEHSDKTTDYNGLAVGIYKNTENNKHYIVFRGTDTTGFLEAKGVGETDTNNTLNVIDPVGRDGIADSDGATNSEQGLGKLPPQYQRASAVVKELLEQHPNLDWTIVGHSLGGGLATYSSTQSKDKKVNTVVFNPAQLHADNIIGTNTNVPFWSLQLEYKKRLDAYAKNTSEFGNVNTYIFDKDILQLNNKIFSHIPATSNAYIGNKNKLDFFTTNSDVDDHLMTHVIKTQQLADIMTKNNEISANCQKDCVKLQEHQWTPAPKLAETKKSAGDTIRYNNEVGNAIRQKFGDKTDEIFGNVGLLDPTKPIAVVTNSDTIFTTNGKIVSVERGEGLGKQIFALKEWNVENGDIIRTADKKVTIQFSDGSWVELAPYTMVRIDFSHKKDGDDDLIANYLVLHKGQGQILTKGTKKPE